MQLLNLLIQVKQLQENKSNLKQKHPISLTMKLLTLIKSMSEKIKEEVFLKVLLKPVNRQLKKQDK